MARLLDYNAELVARDDLTPDLAVFHVRHDEPWGGPGEPAFIPGQYVAIGLNNEEKPALGAVRRSMSLASAPEELGASQFYVRLVRQPTSKNPLTPLLWQRQIGDRMFMTRRPVGKLTIPATVGTGGERMVVMVAAGTGLAPFVSIVRSECLRHPDVDLSRHVILHGASYPRDLGYREELLRYQAANGLHYLPTISRPREAPEWPGHTGRVEDFFTSERLGELEALLGLGAGGFAPDRVAVLVCGLEGTIGSTFRRLLARGFVPEHRRIRAALELGPELVPSLWWEQYDASPVVDLHDQALVDQLRDVLARAR
jgi:ferredoxin--NADP+ reductase